MNIEILAPMRPIGLSSIVHLRGTSKLTGPRFADVEDGNVFRCCAGRNPSPELPLPPRYRGAEVSR